MPIISADELGADYEDKAAPEGTYEVRIQKADYKPTKKGDRNMVAVMLTIDGSEGDGVTPFNEFLILPSNNEEPKTKRLFMQRLVRFLQMFGVPANDGFDPEDAPQILPGLTAKCPVVQEEGDDGVIRNRLKLPRVGR